VALYGATTGEAFLNGMVGERFAVRNSGATAVVEGVGDHGCEYMTKGLVVVIGATGRNFAAGMTGGLAYVLDESGEVESILCNRDTVDVDPVSSPEDWQVIYDLVAKHVAATASPRGKWVLDNFTELIPKFRKIFPHEFKRVLGIPRAAAGAPQPRALAMAMAAPEGEGVPVRG
jgi:glutamate synthase domain-containing protein 3